MSDQNVQTVFSVGELIAVIPPPRAACLHASALVRAALTCPPVLHAREQHLRWWQMVPDLLRDGGILVARDAPRGQRRVAFWGALVYQLLWLMALIWLAYARFSGVPGVLSAQDGGIVEVEFIDRAESSADSASSASVFGNPAPTPLDAAPVSRPIAPAIPVASQSRPPMEVPSPPAPALTVTEPDPDPDPIQTVLPEVSPFPESPLQVTEVAEPDQEFTLHAPELSSLPAPPDLRVPTLPLQVTEIALQSSPPRISAPALQAPPLSIASIPLTEVTEREIPLLSVPTPVLSQAPASAVTVPTPPDVVAEVELRDIPLLSAPSAGMLQVEVGLPAISPSIPALEPQLRPIPGPLPEVSLLPRAVPDLPPGVTQGIGARATRQIKEREIVLSPAAVPIRGNTGIATGETVVSTRQSHGSDSGSASTASVPMPSGSVSSTSLRDEWGQTQAAAGGGLLDQAGRPRLADSNTGRLPPGTVVENYQNIDRMGTWLKRPPTGYQSSVFEQFWLPPENLLEEWVRRSIKTIYIPIPGTGKSIQCTVAFLMLGGGCGITDANLMDIEATARKPPEVPFKPELYEDPSVLAAPPPQHPQEP